MANGHAPLRQIPRLILALCAAALLGGCAAVDLPGISAGGPVAAMERDPLFRMLAVILAVAVPAWALAVWFARRRRALGRGTRAGWLSDAADAAVWAIPALVMAVLGIDIWAHTRGLDAYQAADVTPLKVEVVAEDSEWLFIYPGQGIATVNQLAFPSQVPLSLTLTSDAATETFSIPALGRPVHALAGTESHLDLFVAAPARFLGREPQPRGPAGPGFAVEALSPTDFAAWVAHVKASRRVLDAAAYARLVKSGARGRVVDYARVEPGLFDSIVGKYRGATKTHTAMAGGSAGGRNRAMVAASSSSPARRPC